MASKRRNMFYEKKKQETTEIELWIGVELVRCQEDLDPWEMVSFLPDLKSGAPSEDVYNPCPGHATGEAGDKFQDLIDTLVMSQCLLAAPCHSPRDSGGDCRTDDVFDFIVVGGGTAGAVVASRLSEISSWNVLLLEAGADKTMSAAVPALYLNLQKTGMDWELETQRDEGMYNGLTGRVNRWPRGKVLGGTSAINAMIYIRGGKRDYDNWAADGNAGWSYEDVLPLFKKSEDMRDMSVVHSETFCKYHSRGGPLTVSRFGSDEPIIKVIQDAGMELGYASNFDMNSVGKTGFTSPSQGGIKVGERFDTADAFLSPARHRKNLFVIKHALVTKIHISPKNKRAFAVSYLWKQEKIERTLRASREIIVCAGTVGSAKLLMLSGIGPKHTLEDVGIDVIQELKVGRNLQDHVMFFGAPITLSPVKHTGVELLEEMDSAYEYLTRRTGPLATIGVSELVGFVSTTDEDIPDLQLSFVYGRTNDTKYLMSFLRAVGVAEDLLENYMDLNSKWDLLLPIVVLVQPKSRGTIKLKSCNPSDPPLIRPEYMTEPQDLETMLQGIRWLERLVKTEAMSAFDANIRRMNFPGCCNLEFDSDAYWACAISHLSGTFFDPVGTCRMGPRSDPTAVVDQCLKVHNVKGLRVADASIMPTIVTGNTYAACVMIGEKVSELIKIQWLGQKCHSSTMKQRFDNAVRLPYTPSTEGH